MNTKYIILLEMLHNFLHRILANFIYFILNVTLLVGNIRWIINDIYLDVNLHSALRINLHLALKIQTL